MIRHFQALNFRCLRYVDLSLDRCHVLIGPNASGKSTLFDAIAFLGDLMRSGLEEAVGKRTASFQDLVWNRPREDPGVELAIEVDLPPEIRKRLPPDKGSTAIRYEIAIRDDSEGLRISSERALLTPRLGKPRASAPRSLFPLPPFPPRTILLGRGRAGMRSVASKSDHGTDSSFVETAPKAGIPGTGRGG